MATILYGYMMVIIVTTIKCPYISSYFSSPEPKAQVRYYDQHLSVVRLLSVVRNLFK